MLEEATVDVAGVTTLTFGDNVTEPYGSHLLELAVADGTGKVSKGGLNVGEVEAVVNCWMFCCFSRCTSAVQTGRGAFARALLTAAFGSPTGPPGSSKH